MAYIPKNKLSKVRAHQSRSFKGYHAKRIAGYIGRGSMDASAHTFSRNASIEEDFAASLYSTGAEYRI